MYWWTERKDGRFKYKVRRLLTRVPIVDQKRPEPDLALKNFSEGVQVSNSIWSSRNDKDLGMEYVSAFNASFYWWDETQYYFPNEWAFENRKVGSIYVK